MFGWTDPPSQKKELRIKKGAGKKKNIQHKTNLF